MEWGFNSPLAHDETADPLRICGFCFPGLLLVAPLVFRAPQTGPPDPPVPFTPEMPGVLKYGSVPCLEARLGPAAAHQFRT